MLQNSMSLSSMEEEQQQGGQQTHKEILVTEGQ